MKKIILLFLLIPMFGAAQQTTAKKQSGKQLKGIASYYANRFVGLRTATGEIYKHTNLTAASNNFKLNSWVRVTNLVNNMSVIVRINDRMHPRMAARGRIVDLTKRAANLLGGFDGLTRVKVEVISGDDVPSVD